MANGFELGTAWIQISPSMSGMARAIESELGSVNVSRSVGGWGRNITGTLGDAFKTVGKIGVGALGAIGATVAGMAASGGISRALSIENAQAKLKGLGHDASSVSGIMDNALASVKGTAYGLGDAATVAASLSASGIKQGKELEGVLRTVADTAQISGRSMTDIGTIFGSVAARGKLQGDDMLQLMSAGVPVLQFLSEQLGVTSADVSKMVSKGEIDFQTFASAMQAGLGGAALAAGDTFTGAFANVKAALGRFGAAAATPALEGLRVVFLALAPAVDSAITALQPFMETVGEKIAAVSERIAGALEKVDFSKLSVPNLGSLSSLLPVLGGLSGFLGPILSQIPLVGGAFTGLTGPVGLVIGLFGQMFSESSVLRDAVGGLFSQLGSTAQSLSPVISQVTTAFASFAGAVGDQLGTVLNAVAPILTNLAMAILPPLVAVLTTGLDFISSNLGWLLPLAGVIGGVVLAFQAWTAVQTAWNIAQSVGAAVTSTFTAARAAGLATTTAFAAATTAGAAATTGDTASRIANNIATAAGTAASIGARIATIAGTVATGAATAAQWAFNAAMNANPIALIILAIAALVGALVWFFTQTEVGQQAWQGFMDFLGTAWTWLNDTVIQPVVSAIGTAITWLNDNIIQPVGAGIAAAVDAIGAVFQWLWDNVLSPVINFIVGYLQVLWNIWSFVFTAISVAVQITAAVLAYVFQQIVDGIVSFLAPIFQWLYDNVIAPVWNGIQAAIQAVADWWTGTVVPAFQLAIQLLGQAFQWIYDNVIAPVWNGIQAAIAAVVDWFQNTAIPNWKSHINAVGAVFQWLYDNIIKPVWDGIQSAIDAVATWFRDTVKPIWDNAVNAIGQAFQGFQSTIEAVWTAIKDAAKAPVEFVVNTVYRDGIKKTFDDLAEAVGLKLTMPDPPNLAALGFASGGVLPGYTPGRDVHRFWSPTAGGLALSGGEAIMRPEFTRLLGVGGIDALNRAARLGDLRQLLSLLGAGATGAGPAFASGGVYGPRRAFADGGIWDAVGGTFAGVGDWLSSVANSVASIIRDPMGAIEHLILDPMNNLLNGIGAGNFGKMLTAGIQKSIEGVGEWFRNLLAPTTAGATGGGVPPGYEGVGTFSYNGWLGGPTLARIIPWIEQLGLMVTDTYGSPEYNASLGRVPTSYHGDASNPAVDVAGSQEAMWAFYRLLMADPYGWRQILWQVAGHYDHVHVANKGGIFGQLPTAKLYDSGGWLQPGLTLAYNATGKPEPVFTNEQWKDMRGTSNGLVFNQTNYMPVTDPNVVGDRLAAAAARGLVGVSL